MLKYECVLCFLCILLYLCVVLKVNYLLIYLPTCIRTELRKHISGATKCSSNTELFLQTRVWTLQQNNPNPNCGLCNVTTSSQNCHVVSSFKIIIFLKFNWSWPCYQIQDASSLISIYKSFSKNLIDCLMTISS